MCYVLSQLVVEDRVAVHLVFLTEKTQDCQERFFQLSWWHGRKLKLVGSAI